MCEIFPEVPNCCLMITLRIGMLFISVLSIMTGVAGLCGIEKASNASFSELKNVTDIREPQQALSKISLMVPTGITLMSWVFMAMGLVLLFATLWDSEGFAQMFVWAVFLNVILGFFLVVGLGVECLLMSECLLSGMDWLSSSALLVAAVAYLFVWIYFVVVTNSYVLSVSA